MEAICQTTPVQTAIGLQERVSTPIAQVLALVAYAMTLVIYPSRCNVTYDGTRTRAPAEEACPTVNVLALHRRNGSLS